MSCGAVETAAIAADPSMLTMSAYSSPAEGASSVMSALRMRGYAIALTERVGADDPAMVSPDSSSVHVHSFPLRAGIGGATTSALPAASTAPTNQQPRMLTRGKAHPSRNGVQGGAKPVRGRGRWFLRWTPDRRKVARLRLPCRPQLS